MFALPVAVFAAYLGYQRLTSQEQEVQLLTARVTRGDVARNIDATGRLEAVTTVQVGSQLSGTIKDLYADFNSQVKRGQVIARLEPSLFETQVQQAQATVVRLGADADRARVQFEDAQTKLNRARDLASRQLIPMTDLETADANAKASEASLKAAQAQVVQAEASLNQTKVNLGLTVIAAPVDGVVISRNVDVGQTVAASMQAPTLFQIANDLTQMQVSANVDEADIGNVAIGQPVSFQVDAYPGQNFSGTVSQVRLNPVIESNVVSYVTIITVPNPDLRLRLGMTATVTIEVARATDALIVPTSALRFSPTPDVLAALGESGSPAATEGAPPPGLARQGAPPATEEQRGEFRERLAAMTPEERQAFMPRGGRRGGDPGRANGGLRGDAAGTASPPLRGSAEQSRVWTVVDGRLRTVPIRTGLSNGASVAVVGGGLQEGDLVATGVADTTVQRRLPLARLCCPNSVAEEAGRCAEPIPPDAGGSDMSGSLISVRELTKTYHLGEVKVRALRGVSLDVAPSEFIALTGPSGSGKSTFMHLLGCLDRPTSGSYELQGRDVAKLPKRDLATIRNREIGFVFQGFNLLPRTSALENVELPLLYAGGIGAAQRKERAKAALESVGLGDRLEHHPNQMSGGQQQRVAIARALVTTPVLLLADEPTGNLDSRTSIEVMDIFQRLNAERGLTILLVTHEPDIAQYSTRIVSFIDGRVRSDREVGDRRLAATDLQQLAVDHDELLRA